MEWGPETERVYHELINEPDQVGRMIESFRAFIGTNQMMAYLVMMAVRLRELHRVLKPTGSLYLHCDPTASHYLKILLDTIFGAENYRNEIVWQRFGSHNDANRFGRVSDTILFYSKTQKYNFNPIRVEYSEDHLKKRFRYSDPDGRKFWPNTMLAPGGRGPSYEWNGHTRNWRFTKENMEKLEANNEIYYSEKGMPYRKNYLDSLPGQLAQNVWTDIKMTKSGAENLGYPTQKPVALLERIIQASSNEGDVVLDPFCGCGTTIAAAQKLNREWIGIDVTHLSVGLQKLRLKDSFSLTALTQSQADKFKGELPPNTYKVVGQPEDLAGAKELAEKDKYGFQWWVLPLIGAKAFGSEAGKKEGKKGADGGIDGMIVFTDDTSGKAKKVIVSVKGGGVNVSQIRDLGHVIDRENAAIGVYLTLEPPTKPMLQEATEKGFYHSPGWNKDYPRIQILTVEDLLNGKTVDLPPNLQTFKQADRVTIATDEQNNLFPK